MSMKIKKNLCRFFRGVWGSLLCTVALFASCRDDLEAPILSGEGIHFSVSEDSDWRITRGSASRMEEAPSLQDSLLEVLPLQTTDGGHGLYLHAFLTEKASAVCTDGKEAVTRSAPVETATFYDSFGVLASVYTGTWNEAACLIICTMSRLRKLRAGRPPIVGRVAGGISASLPTLLTTDRESFFRTRRRPVFRRSPIRFRRLSPTRRICSLPPAPQWRAIPPRRLR